ncbi:MAG: EAL domain-containing protein [Nitrospinales bacterium]
MDTANKKKLLKTIDFLMYLPDPTLDLLVQECKEVNLKAGDILFTEKDHGETMYIILDGEVSISKENVQLGQKSAGDYFGEMALIESEPRSATVKANVDTLLIEIYQKHFTTHFLPNSHVLLSFLKTLSQQARSDSKAIEMSYQKLQQQENLSSSLRSILDDTSNEIFVCDAESFEITQVNSRACKNLGFSEDDLIKMNVLDILKDTTTEKFKNTVEPLVAGHQAMISMEGFLCRKNGETYPIEARLQVSEFQVNPRLVLIAQDITERKEMENKIINMAYYDALTSLPNRNLMDDRLKMALAQADRNDGMLAVLLLDMDNFKVINDTMGHQMGDKLLQEVAQRLKACLRKEDTIARMGGDEFVVILTGLLNENDASQLAKKILDSLKKPFKIYPHEIFTTFSIGISFYPTDGKDPQALLMNADAAMYKAKEGGKNTFKVYNPSLVFQATRKRVLESGLRRALDNNEFVLYYQPKLDVKTKKWMGVEALLRWEVPFTGLISPGEFIPVAEDSRLIIPIGEWVLRTACKQMKAWEEMGLPPLSMAVNLSGHQFIQKNLVDMIKDIIKETHINANYLELELTESLLMENSEEAISKLRSLDKMGIHLSIDDFGTGYSSLQYLKNLPIHALKIDQSFVQDLATEANVVITRAIVSLAKTLKLKTIVEGVETEEQRKFMESLGCDILQGYFFGKPMTSYDITQIFSSSLLPTPQ